MKRSVVAEREQVPLSLAFALTVHKSQGMSLDRVSISMGEIFEDGQVGFLFTCKWHSTTAECFLLCPIGLRRDLSCS